MGRLEKGCSAAPIQNPQANHWLRTVQCRFQTTIDLFTWHWHKQKKSLCCCSIIQQKCGCCCLLMKVLVVCHTLYVWHVSFQIQTVYADPHKEGSLRQGIYRLVAHCRWTNSLLDEFNNVWCGNFSELLSLSFSSVLFYFLVSDLSSRNQFRTKKALNRTRTTNQTPLTSSCALLLPLHTTGRKKIGGWRAQRNRQHLVKSVVNDNRPVWRIFMLVNVFQRNAAHNAEVKWHQCETPSLCVSLCGVCFLSHHQYIE